MNILNGSIANQPAPDPLALEMVQYRVLGNPYSKWRAILAETGESDTNFKIGLKELHGLEFETLRDDPMLYITQDTQQMRFLAENGVANPTMLQILMTSRVFALSEEAAHERMQEVLHKAQEPEPPTLS